MHNQRRHSGRAQALERARELLLVELLGGELREAERAFAPIAEGFAQAVNQMAPTTGPRP